MIPVQIRMPKKLLDMVDGMVGTGLYSNRSQVIRSATRDLIVRANRSRIRDISSASEK